MQKHIAIFASGSGSNALKILENFEHRDDISVSLIVTNKKNAGVINHAHEFDVPVLILDRETFYDKRSLLDILKEERIEWIILAGFLWLVPDYLIEDFPNKIINIHPALLPKYGGKGMYGMNVHRAVKAAGDLESGITIHYVNQNYDEGEHIFQKSCKLEPGDTPEEIRNKVLTLEHQYFPKVIDDLLKD